MAQSDHVEFQSLKEQVASLARRLSILTISDSDNEYEECKAPCSSSSSSPSVSVKPRPSPLRDLARYGVERNPGPPVDPCKPPAALRDAFLRMQERKAAISKRTLMKLAAAKPVIILAVLQEAAKPENVDLCKLRDRKRATEKAYHFYCLNQACEGHAYSDDTCHGCVNGDHCRQQCLYEGCEPHYMCGEYECDTCDLGCGCQARANALFLPRLVGVETNPGPNSDGSVNPAACVAAVVVAVAACGLTKGACEPAVNIAKQVCTPVKK
jgi:hypothetical protein